jgi:hypothetical protein
MSDRQSGLARLVELLRFSLADVAVAWLVAFLVPGGGPILTAKLVLAAKLNLFALPLSYTPVLAGIPPWAWYVLTILWLRQALRWSGHSLEDVLAELDADARRVASALQERRTTRPAVTDGGEPTDDHEEVRES